MEKKILFRERKLEEYIKFTWYLVAVGWKELDNSKSRFGMTSTSVSDGFEKSIYEFLCYYVWVFSLCISAGFFSENLSNLLS